MDPLERPSQKLSTTKERQGKYIGMYKSHAFKVEKSGKWWEGKIADMGSSKGVVVPRETKREVVNVIKKRIDRKHA